MGMEVHRLMMRICELQRAIYESQDALNSVLAKHINARLTDSLLDTIIDEFNDSVKELNQCTCNKLGIKFDLKIIRHDDLDVLEYDIQCCRVIVREIR